MTIQQLQDMAGLVNISKKFGYPFAIQIANNSDTQQVSYTIGNMPLYIENVTLNAVDSLGIYFDTAGGQPFDDFTIQIEDSNNHKWFQNPIKISSFKDMLKTNNFRGYVLEAKMQYTVTIKAIGFPSTSAITYPVNFEVMFMGSQIDGTPNDI